MNTSQKKNDANMAGEQRNYNQNNQGAGSSDSIRNQNNARNEDMSERTQDNDTRKASRDDMSGKDGDMRGNQSGR